MSNLTIINQNETMVIDSREVAEMVDMRHDNLISKIRGYIDILDSSKLRSRDFFISSSYFNVQNKEQPLFLLTRKGCDMVANKLTGEKGVLFTAAYVTKFEEMENNEKQQLSKLSKELRAIIMLDEKQQIIENKVHEMENKVDEMQGNMPLFNIECKELQSLVKKIGMKTLGGYQSPAYKNNSLRGKVYADIQYQLKREFGVHRYEAIKRSQLDTAIRIVEAYQVPTILSTQIELLNNQITI